MFSAVQYGHRAFAESDFHTDLCGQLLKGPLESFLQRYSAGIFVHWNHHTAGTWLPDGLSDSLLGKSYTDGNGDRSFVPSSEFFYHSSERGTENGAGDGRLQAERSKIDVQCGDTGL